MINKENNFIISAFSKHFEIKNHLLKLLEDEELQSDVIDLFNGKPNGFIISKTDYFIEKKQTPEYVKFFWPLMVDHLKFVMESNIETFSNIWIQQYYQNSAHNWHDHPNSTYSAIYYVELDEESPGTLFKINDDLFSPSVSEGDVLIFPSHIFHCSPKNKSKKRKTVIAFNL